MYNVAVLMSTYNGEKYIEEQIESLFAQKFCDVTLYLRDDGSTDNTHQIINNISSKYKIVSFWGNNIGWRRSFMELISLVPNTFEYYAFSDQDDVWLPDKIYSSILLFKDKTTPAVCCSGQIMTDNQLRFIRNEVHSYPKNFREAMTNISCRGCSEVFNAALLHYLQMYKPKIDFAHDRWVARVANILGIIYFDKNCHMYYRQHGDNCSGNYYNSTIRQKIIYAFENYKNRDFYYWYAIEILKGYSKYIGTEKKEWLNILITSKRNIHSKINLLFSKDFVSESLKGTILLKLVMLTGVYQS